jgi:hypothetical protein
MNDLLTDISAIVATRIKRSARRQIGSTLLMGLALFFVGIAIVAGIAAIGVVLAARWGVLAACLIIAASALVLTVGLVVVVAQTTKAAHRRQQAEREQWRQALLAAKVIAPDLSAGKALLIATALGLMVGLTARAQSRQ